MTPRLSRFFLTAHVTSSVGWLGAVVAYLALAIAGVTNERGDVVRAAFVSMELIGWFVIVPLSIAALITGIVQSLGTQWGLFRYYWVLAKFVLTVSGITILLLHMPVVSRVAGLAPESLFADALRGLPHSTFVIHAAGGLLVLLSATVLSVYKPWGMTSYGRTQHLRTVAAQRSMFRVAIAVAPESLAAQTRKHRNRWLLFVVVGIAFLILALVILHLFRGGMAHR